MGGSWSCRPGGLSPGEALGAGASCSFLGNMSLA
jgi:hypothetical protein